MGAQVMIAVKGMVSLAGNTYRVTKLNRGKYEVVRILDDVCVGTFECEPRLAVAPVAFDETLLKQIAMLALRQGKLSWTGKIQLHAV